jgi:hypothetical protein
MRKLIQGLIPLALLGMFLGFVLACVGPCEVRRAPPRFVATPARDIPAVQTLLCMRCRRTAHPDHTLADCLRRASVPGLCRVSARVRYAERRRASKRHQRAPSSRSGSVLHVLPAVAPPAEEEHERATGAGFRVTGGAEIMLLVAEMIRRFQELQGQRG